MPARSKAQQRLMGADYARAIKGEPTRTGMSADKLRDFATTKRSGLPDKVGGPKARYRHAIRHSKKLKT